MWHQVFLYRYGHSAGLYYRVTDTVDAAARSRMMSSIRSKNTRPELFVRKTLHAAGFRYVLGGGGLPGRPDLIFPSRRAVVFVNGCFWHSHGCELFKWPSTNRQFWRQKLDGNSKRDSRVKRQLDVLGWRVYTVWECELRKTKYKLPNRAISRVSRLLKNIDNIKP